MAPTPVFISTLARLKSELRLSGVTDGDGLAILHAAVTKTRVDLYARLGDSRINYLLLTPEVENPSTADQVLRTRGASIECKMVRLELLRTMPMLLAGGASAARQVWNEEGIVRDASQLDRENEIERLAAEIEEGLGLLDGDTDDDESSGVRGGAIGPRSRNGPPGAGVLGRDYANICGGGCSVRGGCL